jgi:hypothetical protein
MHVRSKICPNRCDVYLKLTYISSEDEAEEGIQREAVQ